MNQPHSIPSENFDEDLYLPLLTSHSDDDFLSQILDYSLPSSNELINANSGLLIDQSQEPVFERKTENNEVIYSVNFSQNNDEIIRSFREILRDEKSFIKMIVKFSDQTKEETIVMKLKNTEVDRKVSLTKKITKKKEKFVQNSKEKKTNPQKNGPKMFGKAMIDFFFDSHNFYKIESFLKKNSTGYPGEPITIIDLQDWIKKNKLAQTFNKIITFKEFWTIKEGLNAFEEIKAKSFRDICLYFLQYEASRMIFGRFAANGNKAMKLENALAFLGIVPILIRGVIDPQNFFSLK